MIAQVSSIFNDITLYGNWLTSMPSVLWSFTKGQPYYLFYRQPDQGTVERVNFLFEKVKTITYYPNSAVHKTTTFTNILPEKYIELFVQKTGGALLATCACVIAAPLGFVVKAIHCVALSILCKKKEKHIESR